VAADAAGPRAKFGKSAQKPYRKLLIRSWGGKIDPSPSTITKYGRAVLEKDPKSTGSLGIAISEAIEDTVGREDTKYSLGSVLNHVMLHQTVIGLEAIEQLKSNRCCSGQLEDYEYPMEKIKEALKRVPKI